MHEGQFCVVSWLGRLDRESEVLTIFKFDAGKSADFSIFEGVNCAAAIDVAAVAGGADVAGKADDELGPGTSGGVEVPK